jgi:superfamily II DNA/RNA helicase
MNSSFEALGIRPELAEALTDSGIAEPSAIQREAIPAALGGADLLAQSQTGTGKTLAYLLPLLERIDPADKELQAVVLAPTRELAVQIAAEIEKYGSPLGIRGQSLIGGAAISRQIERLRLHPHIVVGTPGRVAELIGMRKVKMHRVRSIVVDEADQMFALGSAKETEKVLESALRDRQLLFFSATLPAEVRRLAGRWMKEPTVIEIDPDRKIAGGVEHLVFVCEERDKIDTLRRLIRLMKPRASLVFVTDIDRIAEVAAKLQYVGLSAEALYGDAPKQERATLLGRFRSGRVGTLVATDVAARGLDIEGLTHVFHLEPALDAGHYVHRAGRTGRMGKSGWSVSIVTEREMFIIRKFEKQLGIAIRRKAMYKGEIVEPHQVPAAGRTRPAGADKRAPKRADAADAKRGVRGDETAAIAARPAKRQGEPKLAAGSASVAGSASAPAAAAAVPGTSSRRGDAASRSAVKPGAAVPASRKRAQEREIDRKNKGAPRWLKQKWQQSRP